MHTNQPINQSTHDDEIDLFELAADLWREKILIILITFAVTLTGFVYIKLVPNIHTYSNQITLKASSLHQYGQLAKAMQTDGKQGLEVATELANSHFRLLQKNLDTSANAKDFAKNNQDLAEINFNIVVPKNVKNSYNLTASSKSNQQLAAALDGYLAFVADLTAEELNTFYQGLGIEQQVNSQMLFSQQSTIADDNSLVVKPNKKLILVVVFVLGGMLGVFAALLKTAIRKRKNQ